jgi:hypothetical protein
VHMALILELSADAVGHDDSRGHVGPGGGGGRDALDSIERPLAGG